MVVMRVGVVMMMMMSQPLAPLPVLRLLLDPRLHCLHLHLFGEGVERDRCVDDF